MPFGEFWLINGQAAGADGDIGDTNHAGMVQEQVLRELVEEINSETGLDISEETDWFNLDAEIQKYLDREVDKDDTTTPSPTHDDVTNFILNVVGFDKDKFDVVTDTVDPRDYGLQHLGWKRMKGDVIQTWTLTQRDLAQIADGVYDAYNEECEGMTFVLEVSATGKMYSEVPWEVLSSENVSSLREFETHYGSVGKKASLVKDLDFLQNN